MPSRRHLLKLAGAVPVFGAGGLALWSGARANAYYRGPTSDHFDGVCFFNPGGVRPRGPGAFLKWQFGERGEAWPASFPSPFSPDRPPPRFAGEGVRVAFIGHASFLLQMRGMSILVDPVWSDRASPVAFAGPLRVNAPGIAFEHLPSIDAVLVTHNHYDHMDLPTIRRLWKSFSPRLITPLGNDAIIRRAMPGVAVEAVDWGETVDLGAGVRVHAEPSAHWSARGIGDRMHALWASFVVEAGGQKIYCVGDTGFGDGAIFRRVRARHPSLVLALLPIGAYEPRWFMRNQHMNPEEAVEAFVLSGAAQALGHHWGTFRLTNEGVERPAQELGAALARRALPPARFSALRPGEVRILN